jgi:hypothetical protein
MEFKVGNRVKYGEYTGVIAEVNVGWRNMNLLFLADEGQGFKGHNGNDFCKGKYTGNRCFYPFVSSLTLLPPLHPITITSDGHKTTATYNGKSAVAKCNPSDTFDIFKSAKLALERLEAIENFKPYLKSNDDYFYGYIGEPTNIKDQLGNSLDIGDTVRLYHKTYGYLGEYSTVKREDKYCIMSMGFSEFPRNNYIIIKERSYTEVTEDKVDDISYVRTPRLS